MTAPVNDSPFLASLTKPLIVADFGVSFSENPGRRKTKNIRIKNKILLLIKCVYSGF
jgi:hypothetical protein